jgi:SAM-dependent methyltransferase
MSIARSLQDGGGMNKVAFVVANAEAPLPFARASFDKVLFLDVCEHLNRRAEVLREIERVLRPDGLMLVSAPNRENSWKRCLRAAGLPYYSDADHKIEYTLAELEAELSLGGFHVVGAPQPVVLETPFAGLIDFAGGISLGLYARLHRWKIEAARRNPSEATGWRVVCAKTNARAG